MTLASHQQAEALLFQATRLYGVKIRPEQVQRAVAEDAQFAEWATSRLSHETLLTREELSLFVPQPLTFGLYILINRYTALDRSGQVDKLADLHDLAEVHETTEEDLRLAIDQLKGSTERITRRAETLRLQQDALARLVRKEAEEAARRDAMEAKRVKAIKVERDDLALRVADLSRSIDLRITELSETSQSADATVQTTLSSALRSDDRLLASLQKLGQQLEKSDPDDVSAIEHIRETCLRCVHHPSSRPR